MGAFTEVRRWERGLSCVDGQVYGQLAAGADEFLVVVRASDFPARMADVLPQVVQYLDGFDVLVTGVRVQGATAHVRVRQRTTTRTVCTRPSHPDPL